MKNTEYVTETKQLQVRKPWIYRIACKMQSLSLEYPLVIFFILTIYMEQVPTWKANRFLATQEITHILWDPKVHYHLNKSPQPIPVRSQNKPFFIQSHLLKILFNIFLPSTPGSYTWALSIRVPTKPLYALFLSPIRAYMPRSSNSSRFHHLNYIWWEV
jgi:hypothetical protein